MGRSVNKPEYNAKRLQQKLLKAVILSYNNPAPDEVSDKDKSHKQLKLLAEEFFMTPFKVRKLLITGNAYVTDISRRVQRLYADGKSIQQIQEILVLSRAYEQSIIKVLDIVQITHKFHIQGRKE